MGRGSLVFITVLIAACTQRDHATPPLPDASATAAPSVAPAGSSLPPSDPSPATARAAPPADAPPPSAVAEWVWKTHRGDRFMVLFPGEPKLTVLPPEEDRVGFNEAKLDVPGGQVSFAAGFSEYPQADVAKPDEFLEGHANAPRRGFTDVLTKRPITLAGVYPGRVLILRRNLSGTPLRIYSRIYLVGRRLYSLIVSTLDVGGVSEDVVKKFMDSFKLS